MSKEIYIQKMYNVLIPLTKDFPKESVRVAWEDWLESFHEEHLNKNEFFSRGGEIGGKLGFICSGFMRAFHIADNGNEYTKTFFRVGDFVAPLGTLTNKKESPIALQTLTKVKLLSAKYDVIEQLLLKHHCLEHATRIMIQNEWVKKEIREIRLVTLSAEERYKIFLEEYKGLNEIIPWYYIASFLGITPVSLSRIRAKLHS
ncbi:MAG: Crp/Fnr family transcriptional regulator [Leptospiraceae bacterium]|nr:Crp/Fnr family transcriptional regulator [Leptospiraceae bacterium]MCP5493699.1 Crp/Fnr family transcriptional regulator [Leptospiraceae bacterium]